MKPNVEECKEKMLQAAALIQAVKAEIPITGTECKECGIRIKTNWYRLQIHKLIESMLNRAHKVSEWLESHPEEVLKERANKPRGAKNGQKEQAHHITETNT